MDSVSGLPILPIDLSYGYNDRIIARTNNKMFNILMQSIWLYLNFYPG